MTELFTRVYGTEVEYGAEELPMCSNTYQAISSSRVLRYLPKDVIRSGSGGMLSNGARYYGDANNHLEYATAEHTSLWETVAAEMAGERIVSHGIEKYAEDANIKKAQLFKSVYENDDVTWGYHFNISADATKIPRPKTSSFREAVHLLGLHLATYNLYAGGGTIYYEKRSDEYKFSLAQKALGLSCDFKDSTLQDKPLINLRDEPHAPESDMIRMHLTSGDPNISPWASWMTLGTTSLVLRAIEQGRAKPEDILHMKYIEHTRTLEHLSRLTATDLSFSKKLEFEDGKKIKSLTPLQVQEYIYEIVEKTYHTDEESEVLSEWKRTLEDLNEDPMLLEDRSDAIAKMALMKAYAQRQQVEFNDEYYGSNAAQAIDHSFYTIAFADKTERAKERARPLQLLSSKVRSTRFKEWMSEERASEEKVVDNIQNPPRTTRAFKRGNAIKTGNVSNASWTGYTLNSGSSSVQLLHPLKIDDDRLAS